MFDNLANKLNIVFNKLSGKGRITEQDTDDALKDVRLALLEADVNFRVARDFVNKVKEKTVGIELMQSLSPGQQIVKIVHEQLIETLGGKSPKLTYQYNF